MDKSIEWMIKYLKSFTSYELRRNCVHHAGYGAGIFSKPSGEIYGCRFQKIVDEAIRKGLVSKRKTARGAVYLKAI